MTPRRRPDPGGASLVEATVVVALLGLLLAGAVPAARKAIAREEAELAPRLVTGEIRERRSETIATAVARALMFERAADGEWMVSFVTDGDGDGVRIDDVRRGVDSVVEGPMAFVDRYGGARLGFHPRLTQLRSPPPTSAPLGELDDPVRLGLSDTLSFSPRGTMTSGTLYMTDGLERQFAVVVYGMTSRIRVWEYDLGMRAWRRHF